MQHVYGLISDTHGFVHPRIHELFAGVEAILHAGDVGRDEALDELESVAPVFAVAGNVDWIDERRPEQRMLEFAFGKAAILHSHTLPDRARGPEDLARHFLSQAPRLILYGHTHKQHIAQHGGAWVVNPGPACKPRFRESPSVVRMTWSDGDDSLTFESIALDWRNLGSC